MKTQRVLLALVAISLFLTNEGRAQGSLTPSGAPAATMRSLDQIEPRLPISSLPFSISQPGSYYLTKNLAGTGEGVTVAASGVTINLNGFELVGNRLVVGHGITVATGCTNVTIRNGTVRSWGGDGVHASTALYVAVDDLWVEDCAGYGIAMSSGSIGHITSQGNGSGGLFQSNPIPGIGIVVKKNPGSTSEARLINNSGGGLVLQGTCDIEFSGQITGNTGNGITWTSQTFNDVLRMNLTDCDVSHNTGSGLHIDDATPVRVVCTTRRSSFLNNGSDGITLKLTHADAGLQLDLQEGAASDNGGCGMNVQEGRDKENKNVAVDFQFSRNMLSGSAKIDSGVAPSLFSRVVARDNGTTGLYMEGGTWTLENCLVADNTGDGVSMVSRTSVGGHKAIQTIKSCEFSRNGGAGFTITPDVGGGAYKVCVQDLSISKNGANGVVLNGTCELSGRDIQLSDNTGHGLAWFALGGGGGGLPGAAVPSVRMSLQRLRCSDNTLSGLYVSETGEVDVDCSFEACTFDRNHVDGVTLLLSDPASRLGFVYRGGGACDNTPGYGLNLAAGRDSQQSFSDLDLSRNGISGCLSKADVGSTLNALNVVAQGNGLHGFDLSGGACILTRSIASDNDGDGFRITKSSLIGVSDWGDEDCDGCVAIRNGGSGIVLAGFDASAKTRVSIQGGQVCGNVSNGIDMATSPGARGRVQRVYMGDNGVHGLISAASSLTVIDNQVTGNAANGLHIVSGAHVVARNVCTDNVTGVYLATTGSRVLQNTFGGASGGTPQVAVSGTGDVAPSQSAASGTNPLGNLAL